MVDIKLPLHIFCVPFIGLLARFVDETYLQLLSAHSMQIAVAGQTLCGPIALQHTEPL